MARLRKQVSEQEKDIGFLKKGSVARMTRLLEVSACGFNKHQGRSVTTRLAERHQRRADLEIKILAIHQESKGIHGAPRITAELNDRGEVITEKTVAKIMRSLGVLGISPRTFKVHTTVVDPFASFSEDLVPRRFNQVRLDAVWPVDITSLTCSEGDMHLCAIKDEHSKKVLGWAVADHMRTELVFEALDMAVAARGSDVTSTIMHSDQGSQSTADIMKQTSEHYGLRRSMGETGIRRDNVGA